ncbi:MAG: GGDEF domain-containing protein [Deltaproteobacteria bacterium]|nr:GGDEF domain-containing protein [Deltaproteobacteria bacterium]
MVRSTFVRVSFPPDSPLHAFTDAEVDAILASGTVRRCAAGERIITEGEPGDSMYFLIEGQAEATLDTGKIVRTYGPGSYFGELSFINPGHRRSTSILARTACSLHVLDQRSIQALIASHPTAIFTLLRRTCAFLVDAERNLIADLRRRNAELQDTIKHLEFTRRRLSQEEETARTDGLTGLYNRRGFDAELAAFMERARATAGGLALIAMDLDHFKPVNDTLGHAAGDFVLREVGKILAEGVRKTDLPCRVGGDEFIILLADLAESEAQTRAEALRAAIGAFPHPGNDRGIRITSTMGGTLYRPGETAAELMHRADEALYAAKRAGRNRVGWA